MNYAMIKNGKIDNIIVADYTMANTLAQQTGHIAVNVDNYRVSIGDIYENGSFMNVNDVIDEDGNVLIPARTVIKRRMSDEEYIYLLEQKNAQLEQELIDTQLALVELYEGVI